MQSGGNCRPVRRAGKAPGRAQRQLLMDGTAVESAFALLSVTFGESNKAYALLSVTFGESNKAYAPYPTLNTTRLGRKESY